MRVVELLYVSSTVSYNCDIEFTMTLKFSRILLFERLIDEIFLFFGSSM